MITWERHFERVTNLRIQFDVAETAIDGWAQSQEALNRYSNEELEALREIFANRRSLKEKKLNQLGSSQTSGGSTSTSNMCGL
jgi:hypothetical protein